MKEQGVNTRTKRMRRSLSVSTMQSQAIHALHQNRDHKTGCELQAISTWTKQTRRSRSIFMQPQAIHALQENRDHQM